MTQFIYLNQQASQGLDKLKKKSDETHKAVKDLTEALSPKPAVQFGLALVGAFQDAFNQVGQLAHQIEGLVGATGAASAAVQGMAFAANAAGVDTGQLTSELTSLNARMYSTSTGSVGAILGFSRLGLAIREATGGYRSSRDVWNDAIQALIKIKDPAVRAGKAFEAGLPQALEVANRYLTRSGGSVEGAIKRYKEAQKQVEAFGATLSGPALRAIAEYGDATSRASLFVRGLRNAAIVPLYESLGRVVDRFLDLAKKQAGPIQEALRTGGQSFARLEGVVGKLGGQLLGALPLLGKGLTLLAGIANAGLEVASFVGEKATAAFNALGSAAPLVGYAIFAAFAPLSALFIGIGLILDDVIAYSKGAPSVIGDFVGEFAKFKAELLSSPEEQPYLLRFAYELLKIFAEDIPNAYKALKNSVFGQTTAGNVPLARQAQAVFGIGKGTEEYRRAKEEIDIEGEARERIGFGGRVGLLFRTESAKAAFQEAAAQIRAERSGALESTPPERPELASRPVATVPVTPNASYSPGSGPGGAAVVVNQSLNFSGADVTKLKEWQELTKDAVRDGLNQALSSSARAVGSAP